MDASKNDRIFFFFMVLVIMCVLLSAIPKVFIESLWPDEALYAWLAKNSTFSFHVLFSKEFIERQPPLFSFILSLAHVIPAFSDMALRSITILLGVGGVIASFYVGRWIGGSDFVAAICAIGVGFSWSYLNIMPRVLADCTLMLFFLLFMLSLFRALKCKSWYGHANVGFWGMGLLLLKWSGILCLPIMLLCYRGQPDLVVRRRGWLPTGMILITLFLLLLNNFLRLGTVLPNLSALQGVIYIGPPWIYLQNFNFISPYPLASFFIFAGIYLLWKNQHPHRGMIAIWFLLTFLSVSFAGEKDFRYAFLFLPSATILMGIVFEHMIVTFSKTVQSQRLWKVGFCASFIVIGSISAQAFSVNSIDFGYVGFREAGEYISSIMTPSSIVFAESDRVIRYYSGVQYKEYGGRLAVLPRSLEGLKNSRTLNGGPVVLVVDRWEYTQPGWAYPLTRGKLRKIETAGFQLVKTINKSLPYADGDHVQMLLEPVVWIFVGRPDPR